ncbi:MAG: hypothetical protein MUC87_16625 [Bacteroidia bacterium]|nr:hypothetical protein [Bacteroidia bacterium]
MKAAQHIQSLQDYFTGNTITREEIFDFFRRAEPELNESTFRWRLHDLKNKKMLIQLSRSVFSFSYRPLFNAMPNNSLQRLDRKLAGAFQELNYCVWSTNLISEFMLHIPGRSLTIVEVEKDALEPVYYFLKDQKYPEVFPDPDKKEIARYVNEAESPIVILPLITKAPLRRRGKVTTPTLEKLLVDIFCEKDLYAAFQGNELSHIFNTAYSRYVIDFTRLYQYARRRHRYEALKSFISEKTEISPVLYYD